MRSTWALAFIWLVFTGLFAYLAIFYYKESKKKIEPLIFHGRPQIPGVEFTFKIAGELLDAPLEKFVQGFNRRIVDLNSTMRSSNLASSVGYAAAALTALFSMILVLCSIAPVK
jgi:hypothetical protein